MLARKDDAAHTQRVLNTSIRLLILGLLVLWCFQVLKPFVAPVVWGAVLAVAIFPCYQRVQRWMGGRTKLAAATLTLAALAVILVPTTLLALNVVQAGQSIAGGLHDGTLVVPAPPEGLASWPLVGEELDEVWSLAHENLEAALTRLGPHFKDVGVRILQTIGTVLKDALFIGLSILVAGAFLASAAAGGKAMRAIASKLAGERGPELVDLSQSTIRSVANGVVGVAALQGLLAGVGLLAIGVPGAGIWALLVLIVAVIQLPPLLVLGPVIAWVFTREATTPAMIFAVWSVLVSFSDAFLKPMLLGRGVEVPMLVILLGAMGGMMSSGIIGLFVGAVLLSLGYTLFTQWLASDEPRAGTAES